MPKTTGKKQTTRAEQIRKRRAKKRRRALLLRALVIGMSVCIVFGAVFMIVKLLGG